MKIQLEHLKRIESWSKVVDKYSELRVAQYGIDGVIPAEFFPTYQFLREADKSRFFCVCGDVIFLAKKIRLFKVQFNRLEGLPISSTGDKEAEDAVLNCLVDSDWVHKIRCCDGEARVLDAVGFKSEDEGLCANFWVDVDSRVEHTSKSSWKGKNPLNFGMKAGGFEWRAPSEADLPNLLVFYESWISLKKTTNDPQISYDKFYRKAISRTSLIRSDLMPRILIHKDRIIAYSLYMISGGLAHLLVNFAISRTTIDYSDIKKVGGAAGQLASYFGVRSLQQLGIKYALHGFGGDPKGSLIEYKRANSDGETGLKLCTIKMPSKEKPKTEGLF